MENEFTKTVVMDNQSTEPSEQQAALHDVNIAGSSAEPMQSSAESDFVRTHAYLT